MKNRREIILILIPAFLILVLVIVKSFDKNSFDLSANTIHELSLKNEHILSIHDLKSKLESDEKAILIDLREQNDFEANHLEKAINIPMNNLLESIEFEQNINKNNSVVLYTNSIDETAKVWTILSQMGYENVFILDSTEELITKEISKKDSSLGDELLKYKFQPDTTIKLE